jgi:hypothetical protein
VPTVLFLKRDCEVTYLSFTTKTTFLFVTTISVEFKSLNFIGTVYIYIYISHGVVTKVCSHCGNNVSVIVIKFVTVGLSSWPL